MPRNGGTFPAPVAQRRTVPYATAPRVAARARAHSAPALYRPAQARVLQRITEAAWRNMYQMNQTLNLALRFHPAHRLADLRADSFHGDAYQLRDARYQPALSQALEDRMLLNRGGIQGTLEEYNTALRASVDCGMLAINDLFTQALLLANQQRPVTVAEFLDHADATGKWLILNNTINFGSERYQADSGHLSFGKAGARDWNRDQVLGERNALSHRLRRALAPHLNTPVTAGNWRDLQGIISNDVFEYVDSMVEDFYNPPSWNDDEAMNEIDDLGFEENAVNELDEDLLGI